ncbi:MAG: universal stress protein [Anaerolineales bacterium]|nr:universal stress protein [Anaerolineales bacterium]
MTAAKKKQPFHVLFADDGSEHARAGLALLGDLPLPSNSSVTILRAFASTQAAELARLEEALNQNCAWLRNKGLQAKPELLLGPPAEKVIAHAEQHQPDLIVVGAKGLRATFGILLGGVAQQVVEYVCCPVLVVRAPYKGLKQVLLVTDGSPFSQHSIRYLGEFPLPYDTRLEVMHVLPPPPLPVLITDGVHGGMILTEPIQLSEDEARQRAQEEAEGQKLLDHTVAALKGLGLETSSLLKRGDAATEIIEYVKKEQVDLIVTGSRGLSQVKSWLLGSVSRKLVHYSDCSVLVVRNPQTD